jgi:LmbE family N-acetylglucosaminyl deacetylase
VLTFGLGDLGRPTAALGLAAHPDDLEIGCATHQDHRLLSELSWQHFRGATIWEYEIPKWNGDLSRPNMYVPIAAEVLGAKISLLHRNHRSQHGKPWYNERVFRELARLRGMECHSEYAEAFTLRKMVVNP